MKTPENDARISEMKHLRFSERWTLDKIAIKFGLTRERVRQIIGNTGAIKNRNGVSPRSASLVQMQEYVADEGKNLTIGQVVNKFGISKGSKKLNLYRKMRHPVEGENATKGYEIEKYVFEILREHGIKATLTNSRPYDIILSDGRSIEVRSRHCPEKGRTSENYYLFPLSAKMALEKVADFFILVIVQNNDKSLFVIPKEYIHGWVGFCWPQSNRSTSEWPNFLNRFDLLKG